MKTADFLTRKIPIDCLSVRIHEFEPTRGFNYPNMKEPIGSQVHLSNARFDTLRQWQQREMKNRRRCDASIPGRKSASDLTEYKCTLKNETNIHTHIYIIDSSMPWHGGKRLYSPPSKFYFYFIFWLTKRTAIKFHSFFPPLHFFFLSFSEDSAALFLPTFLPRYRFRTS